MDRAKAIDRQEHPQCCPTDKCPAADTPPCHDANLEPKKTTPKEADLATERKRSAYLPETLQKKKNAHSTTRREQQEETTYDTEINKVKISILAGEWEKYKRQETCE